MSDRNPDQKYKGNKGDRYKLELVGLTAESDRPQIVVQALSRDNAVLHTDEVDGDGAFALPAEVLARAHRVVLGAPGDKGGVRADASISYRAGELLGQIKDGRLVLAEGTWSKLRVRWACVSGSVQVCRRRPWWFADVIRAATEVRRELVPAVRVLDGIRPSLGELLQWPFRCEPVCFGTVEVYRRSCCCYPIVIEDPRIDDWIRDLEIYVERLPKLPRPKPGVPPPPPPPPGDPFKTPFFDGGALNELALHATNDLRVLRSLPRDQAAQYIHGRPYLLHRFCRCGQPVQVGSGTIQPDGSFNVCWLEPLRLLLPNCYEQYAYVVKQTLGGTTTTIYDGLAAGAWFPAGDQPVLTSYNRRARSCGETGDGEAYVYLDLIGDTSSHELTTPASTGWDRVATPGTTSGLLFPGELRNLGGAIELTFKFSLGMKALGATHYRLSISEADASGNPTDTRHYHNAPLAWHKDVPNSDESVAEVLGPVSVGGEANLYRIPYFDDAEWTNEVRFHALIDTLQPHLNVPAAGDRTSPAKNRLITLEVFNATGERLRPFGAPASGQPGAEVERAFKFQRRRQAVDGPGPERIDVPYAALTHLFCWDNRPPVADITKLVMDGAASDEECQFLNGCGSSELGIEYRAYVPDPRFQKDHYIRWIRGLNGGSGSLPTSSAGELVSSVNVGQPPPPPPPPLPPLPGPAFPSGTRTFQEMLTRADGTVLPRCAFAVTLTTRAKTTNGEELSYPSAHEAAAFALAIDPNADCD